MNELVKKQLQEALRRIEEKKLYGIEPYDMTDNSDDELSLVVFNTQELYRMRHSDIKGALKKMKSAGFVWSKKQEKVLMDDIADDKAEMENENYKEKTSEEFDDDNESEEDGSDPDDEETDAVEVPDGEEEEEETVAAPDESGNGDLRKEVKDLSTMMRTLMSAIMDDGDSNPNSGDVDIDVGENIEDIDSLTIGDATDSDLEDADADENDSEDDADVIDLDVDDVDDASDDDDEIEVMDLDAEDGEDEEDENLDLEEGVVAALSFGDLTNPEWKKCVSKLLGDNLQNTFQDH